MATLVDEIRAALAPRWLPMSANVARLLDRAKDRIEELEDQLEELEDRVAELRAEVHLGPTQ